MLSSRGSDLRANTLWRAGLALSIGSTVCMALALGGALTIVLLTIAALCLMGHACVFYAYPRVEGRLPKWPAPTWVFFALAGYCVVQALPLPVWLLRSVSPTAGDIWERALWPLQEPVTWGALSLDPGASLREALKWSLYGLNFYVATLVARRHGRRLPALVVFGSSLLVAVATLGHELAGARKVFGVYEPPFSANHWLVGPFLNPNTLSGYLNLGAFTGLGLVFSRRLSRYRWPLVAGVATLFYVSAQSGSRGGTWIIPLGLLLFIGLRLPAARRSGRSSAQPILRQQAPFVVALGCGVVFAAVGASQSAWRHLGSADLEKLRMVVWVRPLLEDFWLGGVGRGAFGSVFPSYAPPVGSTVYYFAENLPVQWLAEWGVVVTVLAVAAFAWAFRPKNVAIRGDNLGAGALTAVVVLLLQNLVDFGLERAASPLALTWLLAVIWKKATGSSETDEAGSVGVRVAAVLAVVTGLWALCVGIARDDLRSKKEGLYAAAQAVDVRDETNIDAFRGRLRSAMLSTPAEPYFSRLGGEISLRAGNADVMRWVSRALERGMNDAENHLLAARALQRHGRLKQALLELRLAAELDGSQIQAVGRYATHWTASLDDLLRAAPKGSIGARVLTAAAMNLPSAGSLSGKPSREAVLRAALRYDSGYTEARVKLVGLLASKLKQAPCRADRACVEDALGQANTLMSQNPGVGLELKVNMLGSLGREAEAEALLARACPPLRGPEHRHCLMLRLRLLGAKGSAAREQVRALVAELSDQPCGTYEVCARELEECGQALLRVGDPAAALDYFERAAHQQLSLSILFKIAEAAVELGQYQRADKALFRARRIATPGQIRRVDSKRRALLRRMVERRTNKTSTARP